jgi:hypothetical protein
MAGHPEAEHLFFAGQLFLVGPIGDVGQRHARQRLLEHLAEQAHLAALAIAPGALAGFHGAFDTANFCARVPSSESMAPADQALDHAPVDGAQVDRSQNSCRSGTAQLFARLAMASTADWPRFFTAPSRSGCRGRRRRSSGREAPLAGIHVGRQNAMPISRHSLMYFTTLAVLPVSEVSSAAMKSTG